MGDRVRRGGAGKGPADIGKGDIAFFAAGDGRPAGESPALLVDAGDRRILDANARAVALLGRPVGELVGKTFPEMIKRRRAGGDGGELDPVGYRFAGAGGEAVFYGLSSASFALDGRPVTMYAFHDVTEWVVVKTDLTNRNMELSHLARHDHLTDLFNRLMFRDTLELAHARLRRLGGHLGVLYIDLDGFKQVNDRFGHDAGDDILKEVGRRLRAGIRTSDVAARLGGDEFGAILENLRAPADALKVARNIIDRIAEPFPVGNDTVRISASIGAAVTDRPLADVAALVASADKTMFEAKSGGRGRASLTTDIGLRLADWPVA